MIIYDEITKEPIADPDLSAGYLYDGKIQTGITEEKTIVMDGTINSRNPKGLRKIIPSQPIYESCQYYHKYTEEEINNIKNNKIEELSKQCNQLIVAGSKIKLSDESEKEFSYSTDDQANISEMFNAILMGATSYPYHANNEGCKMYSAADIVIIYSTLSSLKTGQITYFNQLKQYVKTLNTVSDIESVTYGQELTGEYLETYNTLVESASTEMQKVLSKVAALSI